MAMVDRVVTPTTVRVVSRSRVGEGGRTDDRASAAEAPQMATAPPVRMPKSGFSLKARDRPQPARMVTITPPAAITSTWPPRELI